MDKLTAIQPESADIRALAQLLEYRRKIVQDRVDLSNTITATMKNYYPQVLDWFKEKDTIIFCDFVTRWPSLPEIQKVRKQTLMNFFNQHNSRYPAINEKRFADIKTACTLTNDPGVIEPNRLLIEVLIPQLKLLIEAIERFDREIKVYYRGQDDRFIFDSFPGAGAQLAPRILVAFGSNRERYSSAADLQKYAAVAPVIEQSGKKKWVHWRYSCPTFLRQTFVEWAGLSIRYSFWAKAYYDQQISKGKPHNTVIRALAFKWIRIVFRCWKTNTPYDESTYLKALKKRGSPLLKFAAES
jgi:transposase